MHIQTEKAAHSCVPEEIFLVDVFRPENFHQWKFSWKAFASRSFPVAASDFFPKKKLGLYQLKHSGQVLCRASCMGSHGGILPPEKILRSQLGGSHAGRGYFVRFLAHPVWRGTFH